MEVQVALCPNKECGHRFPTEREEPQCGECGLRFIATNNVLNVDTSLNTIVGKKHKNQIKKIEDVLEKLSNKHEETGIAIKEIRKIAKESIKK